MSEELEITKADVELYKLESGKEREISMTMVDSFAERALWFEKRPGENVPEDMYAHHTAPMGGQNWSGR
ncbi:MAG: hypothetical protein M2R45_02068 [Verrucomicrobia subdivision 3 bacterium]|nr:hypothetical protein [Limisphaerales bacterium]MCS1413873.1 hypothetical protein [Limisphaerales bacterium]